MTPITLLLQCVLAAVAAACLTGCLGAPANPPATQPVTAIDPRTAEAGYWYDKPGVASADCSDFDTLWKACKLAARDDGFVIDRPGYRDGLMSSQPLVSKQFFEPWLQDVVDTHGLLQSSMATMRRTIHFEITKTGDGAAATYSCVPKVLVERYQEIERRVTNESEYWQIFNLTREEALSQVQRDPTDAIPPVYWYPVGRDPDLERQLAGLVREHVSRPQDLQGVVPIG